MDSRTQSERIISALNQLQQFIVVLDADRQNAVISAITGAKVAAVPDPDNEGHGLLEVVFPGGTPFRVIGTMFLNLQLIEDARLIEDGSEGNSRIAKEVNRSAEHLFKKHGIE